MLMVGTWMWLVLRPIKLFNGVVEPGGEATRRKGILIRILAVELISCGY
jgi:hypothetical protein